MNIKELQDLERAKELYRRTICAAVSDEYKTHCSIKLRHIERLINDWFDRKEREQS